MIIDTNLEFSLAQDISGSASVNSTNVIDTGAPGGINTTRDPGTGKPLFGVVVVTLAFTGASVLTTVTLNGDPTATIAQTKTRALFVIPALAALGNAYVAPLVPGGAPEQERFNSLTYTTAGGAGTLTTGKVTAFICENIAQWNAYSKNYTID